MNKIVIALVILAACNTVNKTTTLEVEAPSEWVKNATIYEVNVRQYSEKGDLASFEKDLDRINELGIDILWFMPIQPIGKLNRKAVGDTFVQALANPDYDKYWGSPYSIQNYTEVNPRYGSVDDFKRLVDECHSRGIKVMLDWVGNHTAWDNKWVTDHPEWYTHNEAGEITDPIGEDGKSWGWTDVADLNYGNKEMRKAMIESMLFWVKECNIDGFRCDVAMEVPTDFWEEARAGLETIKPMFMLAESEAHKPDQFKKAFDAYYGWEMHHVFNKLAKGEVNGEEVIRVMRNKDSINGSKAFPMNFITNHDENSWNGTIEERLGDKWKSLAVLSYALRGMPLIYNGQEVGLKHRLSFFAKDEINWEGSLAQEYIAFYKALNKLKEEPAFGSDSPISFDEEYENKNLLIVNRGADNEYRIIFNFSDRAWEIIGHEIDLTPEYDFVQSHKLNETSLGGWGYVILKKK